MKKMKKLALTVFLLLVLLLYAPAVHATAPDPDTIPGAWSDTIDEAPMTAAEFGDLSFYDMAHKFWDMAKDNLLEPIRLFAKLCAVVILTATVKGLSGEGTQSEVIPLLDTVATLAIFTLCSVQILGLMNVVQAALEESRTYMACFVPVFASVMVSCGQAGASLVYSGLFFTVTMVSAQIISGVGLPLTRVLMALHATSAVDSALDLSQLAKSLTKWIKWLLTVFATIFATVLGLQTALAQNADSAALKAGKFLIGSSVPVVGRAVSDAMGSVLAGMKLIKGTVGFAAVAVIGAAFLPVLLQCAAYHAVFTLGGMVAGATGNSKTEKLLDGCAQCVGLYITMSLIFGMMMVATTLVMVVTGTGG